MRSNPSDDTMVASNQLESLTWVLDEVRKSTGIATGALAHVLSEKPTSLGASQAAGAMASPSNLKVAHNEMRRAAGALRMVGQDASADIIADIGTLLERAGHAPDGVTEPLLASVKSICYSVNSYLSGISSGRDWPASVLFGMAQSAASLAGRLTFHPAQLWTDKGKGLLTSVSWADLEVPEGSGATSDPDSDLLQLLKGEAPSAFALARRCCDKGKEFHDPSNQTLAYCGAMLLVCVGKGLMPLNLYVKRSVGKLNQWLQSVKQKDVVSVGLLHELKYFLSSLDTASAGTDLPGYSSLKEQGILVAQPGIHDKVDPFRAIDPERLDEAQKQLQAAKNDWSQLSSGELAVGAAPLKHFSGLHQSMLKLWPDLAIVTTSLSRCVQWVSGQTEAPSNALALEVATALLFLEDTLGDLYSSENGLREKAQAMFTRLEQVRSGSVPQGLEPWMEALFRRSSEKQTMGNVAGELRHLSAEIERQFELVFTAAAQVGNLLPLQTLQGLLTQMRGVLGVVGLDQGVAAVAHLRAKTDTLERSLRDPVAKEQDIANIGSNMASLGLMVDMLSYQPSLANRLFRFEPQTHTLRLLTQTAVRAAPIHVDMPAASTAVQVPIATEYAAVLEPTDPQTQSVGNELKGVFAQEAHEVVEEGLDSVSALALNAKDLDTLVSLRRGFHTLKGSARMVGMDELGHAAWEMEQLLNEQLTNEAQPVSANLCALAKDALGVIGRWSDMLGQGIDPGWTAEPFKLAAQSIRQHDRYLALHMPEPTAISNEPAPQVNVPPINALGDGADSERVAGNDDAVSMQLIQAKATGQEKLTAPSVTEEYFLDELEPTPPVKVELAQSLEETDFDFDLEQDEVEAEREQFKFIGPLKVRFTLYNVFLQEADEVSRALEVSIDEWLLQPHMPLPEVAAYHAHTLAGSSATVGFSALSDLCRTLETACTRIRARNDRRPELARPLRSAVEAVRFLLHQFAAGFLRQPDPLISRELRECVEGGASVQSETALMDPKDLVSSPIDQEARHANSEPEKAQDEASDSSDVDAARSFSDREIWNLFNEEASELIPHISHHLQAWLKPPHSHNDRSEVMRSLHTLKGSARLAGAMQLGDSVHQLESEMEGLDPSEETAAQSLLANFDHIAHALDSQAPSPSQGTDPEPSRGHMEHPSADLNSVTTQSLPDVAPLKFDLAMPAIAVASTRPTGDVEATVRGEVFEQQEISPVLRHAPVRVNARLLDTVMNRTGEVIGSRARVKLEVDQLRNSLVDLNANVEKLRAQLRELEIQAESQMQSRLAYQREADPQFDPLEFDRFTRVQELTRMMAESVSDVATVQRQLQRSVDHVDDSLVAQGRQSSDLQRELLRTRMLPFDTLAQRLHRTVRQAARDAGKTVHLQIEGGNLELDRQQLDRLGPSIEHLIRNAVAHGVETSAHRVQVGKPAEGQIRVSVRQDRNDVVVEVQDDGQGLNLVDITRKAIAAGLIDASTTLSEQQAFNLICLSGFSTAASVTELAGRGIGMDVVKSSVDASGGRMESLTRQGLGLSVRLVLPLTTATTQVLLVRHGMTVMAFPVNMVEQVLRFGHKDLQQAYTSTAIQFGDEVIPFYWAGALLGQSQSSEIHEFRTQPVVVVRSAGRRVAVHVDETVGQQEVIVKSVGGQLSSLPGLTGVSVLPTGSIVLIYNPVALALVYGEHVAQFAAEPIVEGPAGRTGGAMPPKAHGDGPSAKKLVLVVDDSITVRKVTQRLLERAGYRVKLASDGVQALELLRGDIAHELPFIMLADIEMPRMDGFDLVRTMGGDARLATIPVVMITSRLAEKHRELATRLGVKHYLGKPFSEEHLLTLVAQYGALSDQGPPLT